MNNLSGSHLSGIDLLLSLVCDMMSAHGAALFLPSGNVYTLASAANAGSPTPIPCTITPGKGLVGWILRNRQPLIVGTLDDVNRSYLGYYDIDAERRLTAFIGVPLSSGGALCLDAVEGRRSFTPADQRTLTQIAGVIEEQCRLIRENQTSMHAAECFAVASRIQTLGAEVMGWRKYLRSFLHLLRDGAIFDYAALALVPENARSYIIEGETDQLVNRIGADGQHQSPELPLSSGLVGWSYTEGMPVFAEGVDGTPTLPLFGKFENIPSFQSVICLPIKHSGLPCGVLVLASRRGRTFSPHLRSLVQMCAEILGVQLELLYLRHRLQYTAPQTPPRS